MNAIEHGNHNRPEIPVEISVRGSSTRVVVEIVDQGGGALVAAAETRSPTQLAGRQSRIGDWRLARVHWTGQLSAGHPAI